MKRDFYRHTISPLKQGEKMENLIKLVSEKAGIPEAKADTAIQTVVNFLKNKMPGGIGAQVESFIKSGTISNLAGGVKEKVNEMLVK